MEQLLLGRQVEVSALSNLGSVTRLLPILGVASGASGSRVALTLPQIFTTTHPCSRLSYRDREPQPLIILANHPANPPFASRSFRPLPFGRPSLTHTSSSLTWP